MMLLAYGCHMVGCRVGKEKEEGEGEHFGPKFVLRKNVPDSDSSSFLFCVLTIVNGL